MPSFFMRKIESRFFGESFLFVAIVININFCSIWGVTVGLHCV